MKIDGVNLYNKNQLVGRQDTDRSGSFRDILAEAVDRDSDDEALMGASKAMEQWFISQMMSQINLVGENGDDPKNGIIQDLYVNQISEAITNSGGMGLAHSLYRQMKLK